MTRANDDLPALLASAMLAGTWEIEPMLDRCTSVFGRRPRWMRGLVAEVLDAYLRPPADRPRELAAFIGQSDRLGGAPRHDGAPAAIRRWPLAHGAMGPTPWRVPTLDDVGAVAMWCGLDPVELSWFADRRHLLERAHDERLQHYRYRFVPKPRGGVRLIEAPKPRLARIQRHLLDTVIGKIPVHGAAHGFVIGRSAMTHAHVHSGHRTVVHLDVEDFFTSIEAGRVYGVLRTAGYPEAVAHVLTALCTHAVPGIVVSRAPTGRPRDRRQIERWRMAHLPQGAPTSPALANLCCYRLDQRLDGLGRQFGLAYSRYADDLAFSGDCSPKMAMRLVAVASAVVTDEGLRVNELKTRVLASSQRQRITGLVVNEQPNVARSEFDALRALLHNAALYGARSQNREGKVAFRAHVLGRINWFVHVNPRRADRLMAQFDAIDWSS